MILTCVCATGGRQVCRSSTPSHFLRLMLPPAASSSCTLLCRFSRATLTGLSHGAPAPRELSQPRARGLAATTKKWEKYWSYDWFEAHARGAQWPRGWDRVSGGSRQCVPNSRSLWTPHLVESWRCWDWGLSGMNAQPVWAGELIWGASEPATRPWTAHSTHQ